MFKARVRTELSDYANTKPLLFLLLRFVPSINAGVLCPLPQFFILVEMMLVLFVCLFVFLLLVLRNISKFSVWAAVVALKREDIQGSLPRKTPADATHSQTQFGCGLRFGKGM